MNLSNRWIPVIYIMPALFLILDLKASVSENRQTKSDEVS